MMHPDEREIDEDGIKRLLAGTVTFAELLSEVDINHIPEGRNIE
jgi:hypothetical protein